MANSLAALPTGMWSFECGEKKRIGPKLTKPVRKRGRASPSSIQSDFEKKKAAGTSENHSRRGHTTKSGWALTSSNGKK